MNRCFAHAEGRTARRSLAAMSALVVVATLAGCGGGTDGTGAVPPQQAAVTSSGVMTKGSIILNGVHYDDSRLAATSINDDRNRTAAQLATGMVIKLRGRGDDTTGTAEKVKVENEVRGAITSVDRAASPQSFVVHGITVLVDSTTVYSPNLAGGFAALNVGTRVEVHGLRDSTGKLRASRVEGVGPADGVDEVRGLVSNLDTTAHTFMLNGTLTVNYTNATFAPPGANATALGPNVMVEVRGALAGATFNATQIDIEALEDADFRGASGEKQEVEGFVTGFTVGGTQFQVAGRTVTITASTVFVNGALTDLANDVEVEAEGTADGNGGLVASKIKFERPRVQLEGTATSVDANARTLVVLGQTVTADDLTIILTRPAGGGGTSNSLANLAVNECVQVRASLSGGVLVADGIREANCGKSVVQAPVTQKDIVNFTLTFFAGLVADASAAQSYKDLSGTPIGRDAFFAAIAPATATRAGTSVKVRGTLNGSGVLVADDAELEN